jgi:hypothetical protein
MGKILEEIIKDRNEFIPLFIAATDQSCMVQQECMALARNKIFKCIGLEVSERCQLFIEHSDAADAWFCLSIDRVHGEHHKLDVIKWGLFAFQQCELTTLKDKGAAELLPIVLNEHDEGRRVAGDFEHEVKGGQLVHSRLASYSHFKSYEIDAISNVIGNHSGITKIKNESYLVKNHLEDIWNDILMLGDRISAIDPLRVLAYYFKHVQRKQMGPEEAGIFWPSMIDIWKSAINKTIDVTGKYGLNELQMMIFEGVEESGKFIHNYADSKNWDFGQIIEGIRTGDDVRTFNEHYGALIPILPIYIESF